MMRGGADDYSGEEFENLLHYHRESQNHINLMANRESMLIDDLETSRTAIQNVLYYIPSHVEDENLAFQSSPATSGFLVVTPVGNNDSDPQHCYCELFGHKLALKRDPNGRVRQTIPISFVQSEFAEEKEDNDLFLAHLESQEAMNSFKIFSPDGTYVLSASSADIKKAFVDTIVEELKQILDDDLWDSKRQAASKLLPLEREQFQLQMDRHQQIMNSLTLTGLAHNVGLLGSENKDKAGVMRILRGREGDRDKWEDFFFVLAQSTLYYFDHDPDSVTGESSLPKGFIPLKYASISLDERRIKSDRFVFQIQTPLRTVFLRARHPVALAEWVSALGRVMANCQTVHDPVQTSEEILERVQGVRSRVSSVESLLKEKKGIKAFVSFLDGDARLLNCWIAILHYRKTLRRAKRRDPTLSQDVDEIPLYTQEAQQLFSNYVSLEAEESVWESPLFRDVSKDTLRGMEERLTSGDENLFGEIQNALFIVLERRFEEFKVTEQYSTLRTKLDAKDKYFPPPLHREIPAFPENSVLWLVVINPDLSQREIKLSKKRTLATIGRDCANTIVLDDAHVSRSHARITYDDHSAHFMDLGSHHGSYLNGERVLKEQLQEGDRLKIGGCDVIVEVREHASFFQNITSRLPGFARQKTTPSSLY